jgi:putative molybdopterin biosynthesis protein
MAVQSIRNALRRVRHERRLAQQELALRAGISRQTLSEIEAGHSCPSTAIALRLARALHCSVEDLFYLQEDSGSLTARWAASPGPEGRRGSSSDRTRATAALPSRVALGWIVGEWVAHRLVAEHPASVCIAADGLARPKRGLGQGERRSVQVEPLRGRAALRENILAVGCDPALGLLSAWLGERRPDARLIWLHAPSLTALEVLAHGGAHLAGTHLLDERSRDFNVPFVRSLFPHRSMLVINLARWEEGFVVRPGNPLRIREVQNIARQRVRFINRETGSGARKLLDRLLNKARISPARVEGYQRIAAGHLAVAQAVSTGVVDVGIATRAASLAYGLEFIPLAEERSDLVLPQELCNDTRIERILDALQNRSFRRELASLGGYELSESGHLVKEVKAE